MDRILAEMRTYFGADKKRIEHAEKVLYYAKQILKKEKADSNVVIPAAILHDIGIKECERKYASTNGQLQEKEGSPIARNILKHLDVESDIIKEVCEIIASHHSKGEINTINFKVIWDADWLVNLRDEYDITDKNKLRKIIDRLFCTKEGKRIAEKVYLKRKIAKTRIN